MELAVTRLPRFLYFPFALITIMIGSGCFIDGLISTAPNVLALLKDAQIAKSWAQVDATVVASEVSERLVMGSEPLGDPSRFNQRYRTRIRASYQAVVTIRYTVDGKEYMTSGYDAFDRLSGNWERERAKLLEFPVGASVRAWVNPKDPREAVVRVGRRDIFSLLGYPVLVLLGGCSLIGVAIRAFKNLGQPPSGPGAPAASP